MKLLQNLKMYDKHCSTVRLFFLRDKICPHMLVFSYLLDCIML
jgi:hypothetical protein